MIFSNPFIMSWHSYAKPFELDICRTVEIFRRSCVIHDYYL